ncbi:hypothetical protein [Paraburkholderia sp. SIMBA_054]|uniref:hypothetical protein n=1 Tax=Paraburkholderia sp. SIMBA_054 TaxID=3085795 RepID=UPI00397CC2F4
MKVVLAIFTVCAVLVGLAIAVGYASHALWPIACAGLVDIALLQLFDVWGRVDRAIEAAQS